MSCPDADPHTETTRVNLGCPTAEPVHQHDMRDMCTTSCPAWHWDGPQYNAARAFQRRPDDAPWLMNPAERRLREEVAKLQLNEKTPDPEYDADKGVPYREMKKRAKYLLEDFSDAQCRAIVEKVIKTAPLQACEAIAKLWEQEIELAKRQEKQRARSH